jgi:hypothetical protein
MTPDRRAPGLARDLPGLAQRLPALAGPADQELADRIAATQLERLRARFPRWRITRTAGGTFRARHRSTGARLHRRTLAELENGLHASRARRATRRGAGHRGPGDLPGLTGTLAAAPSSNVRMVP